MQTKSFDQRVKNAGAMVVIGVAKPRLGHNSYFFY